MAYGRIVSQAPFAEPPWYSRGISPYYNDSHVKLRDFIRRYVDEELIPYAAEWEAAGAIPEKVYKRHAELGFLVTRGAEEQYSGGVSLPAGIPREEWDGFHTLIATDETTRVGYYGVIMGLGGGNAISCPVISAHGTHEQKLYYLPKAARGEIRLCLGITEPEAGSDVANIHTVAKREGDFYVVSGSKKWITNAIWADFCLTAVRTGGPGRAGISFLIVPLSSPGVKRRKLETSGVNASGSTFIEFDAVRVPCANLVGQENDGFRLIMDNFNPERLAMSCSALRLCRVCAEDAYSHSMTRETFGQLLISHSLIQAKITNFGALIEPAFAFMEQLIWLIDEAKRRGSQPVNIGGMTALLKVMSTRALESCVREGQQVMGGLGYTKSGKGSRIEQISRDARLFVVGGGSEEILMGLAMRQEIGDLRKYAQGTAGEPKI